MLDDADAAPDKKLPAYEIASVNTDFYSTAQCELSQTASPPIGLSNTTLVMRAAGSQGIKVALSGDFLIAAGGMIGSGEAVPSLAVCLEDGAVLPLTPQDNRVRLHHTLTGLHGGPRAILLGGTLHQPARRPAPAPPAMLQLSPGSPDSPCFLHSTLINFHSALPEISGHAACCVNRSDMAVFGGKVDGVDSSALFLLSESVNGMWSWSILNQVSLTILLQSMHS